MKMWQAWAMGLVVAGAIPSVIVVRDCNERERERREEWDAERRDFERRLREERESAFESTKDTGANWWCYDSQCHSTVAACDDVRRRYREVVRQNPAPCIGQEKAGCFEIASKLDGKTNRRCFVSLTYCSNTLAEILRREDADWRTAVDCRPE
jgi:hypothetical protein